jgi:hypothetical protein
MPGVRQTLVAPKCRRSRPVNQISTECRAFADDKPRADRYAAFQSIVATEPGL